ncbi:MAG: metallophosphoesterase family protein [Myxococcota bacterium]|nr:metallophosphoesterase family protein [Myxococcota bacterium]
MFLLTLLACDFYPEGTDSTVEKEGVYGDCDEEIYVPAGILSGDAMLATAHEATFGSSAPDPYQVRYQWPERDPSKSAAFLWRTDTDTLASQIQIGTADGFPDNAETLDGASFVFGGGEIGAGDHRIHEIRMCGRLQPATSYSYRVGGEGHWSDTFTFTTPGEPGSFTDFRVAMAGDSRGAYETWGQMLTAMDSHAPDFYLFSGDMVEFGSAQSEWDAWFEASGTLLAERALISAHGNHEFLAQNYFAQFAFPNNEQWFAIQYGDAVFVSLNDTVSDGAHLDTDQVQYMESVFSDNQDAWKVVNHHQPLYSTCTRHGSKEGLRDDWGPTFDRWKVNMVVAGHNHIYERSVPIREDGEVAPGSGTVYLVSGGAGAPLYKESESEWFGSVANPVEHYIIADFSATQIDVVVRDLQGNVLDEFVVPRSAE